MDKVSKNDYAYLAGLMDADGSFGLYFRDYGTYKSYVVKMQLYNTSIILIDWVNKKFGIKYRQHSVRKNPKWKDCYISFLSVGEVVRILPLIIPFLIRKKEIAILLLEACLLNKKLLGVNKSTLVGRNLHEQIKPRLEIIRLEILKQNKTGNI